MALRRKKPYQVEILMDGSWKIVDHDISLAEATKTKRWREGHGSIARINPMPQSAENSGPVELIPYVDEVCQMLVNGNFTSGLQAVIELPKRQAVVVAAYVCERCPSEHAKSVFLRLLETYGEGTED